MPEKVVLSPPPAEGEEKRSEGKGRPTLATISSNQPKEGPSATLFGQRKREALGEKGEKGSPQNPRRVEKHLPSYHRKSGVGTDRREKRGLHFMPCLIVCEG